LINGYGHPERPRSTGFDNCSFLSGKTRSCRRTPRSCARSGEPASAEHSWLPRAATRPASWFRPAPPTERNHSPAVMEPGLDHGPVTAGGHSTRPNRSQLSDRIGGRLASTVHAQPSPAPHGRRPNHPVCSCHHAPRGGKANSVVRVMLVMYVRFTSDLGHTAQCSDLQLCASWYGPGTQSPSSQTWGFKSLSDTNPLPMPR
jgi:hypothetical protein